jgi:hypothetical protein
MLLLCRHYPRVKVYLQRSYVLTKRPLDYLWKSPLKLKGEEFISYLHRLQTFSDVSISELNYIWQFLAQSSYLRKYV